MTSLMQMPAWLFWTRQVLEALMAIFFVLAWLYSIKLAHEGRRDGRAMRKAIEDFLRPPAAPPPGGEPSSPAGNDCSLQDEALEQIELRRRARREAL